MSKIMGAMKMRIAQIVQKESRPFCIADLKEFEIGGKKYQIKYGTIRNNISLLRKTGFIEPAFRSRPAFYTMRGKTFDKKMTLNRMGVICTIVDDHVLRQTAIYKWVKNHTFEQQALHNIRLTFHANGIWDIFSKIHPGNIEPNSQDIQLQSLTFVYYIDVIITVHHSDTVSVAISCSNRPIAVQIEDFILLFEVLTRTELRLSGIIYDYNQIYESSSNVSIPSFRKWIVKMWHFGVDSIDEYSGKEFEVTFEQGMADLIRIYTKRLVGNKQKLRVERQEYPNQEVADAIVRKLYPNGHLAIPDETFGRSDLSLGGDHV
jgi:hypothetical protein